MFRNEEMVADCLRAGDLVQDSRPLEHCVPSKYPELTNVMFLDGKKKSYLGTDQRKLTVQPDAQGFKPASKHGPMLDSATQVTLRPPRTRSRAAPVPSKGAPSDLKTLPEKAFQHVPHRRARIAPTTPVHKRTPSCTERLNNVVENLASRKQVGSPRADDDELEDQGHELFITRLRSNSCDTPEKFAERATLAIWHSQRKQESYARKSQKSRVKAMLLSGAIEKVADNGSLLEILRSDADDMGEASDSEPSLSSCSDATTADSSTAVDFGASQVTVTQPRTLQEALAIIAQEREENAMLRERIEMLTAANKDLECQSRSSNTVKLSTSGLWGAHDYVFMW